MRLSLDAQKVVYAEETGDYPIILLTLTHPELAEPIRITTDATQRSTLSTDENVVYCTISNSLEYLYCPVEIELPSDEEGAPPQTQLTIGNIGRELVQVIRELRTSPSVSMAVVLASDPDRVEGEIGGFTFDIVDINAMTVSGSLLMDIMMSEPFPYRTFTPSTASGLYKS